MDRSLWLLMKLRFGGLLRRWKRILTRPKGIILTVVTSLLFVPWLFSIVISSQIGVKPPLDQIRRFVPLGLFILTTVSLFFSDGGQSLYYSPSEVTFLFAGPYRKRQLLAYKLVTTMLLSLFSAVIFTLSSSMISPRFLSAFVGFFFLMLFLQTFQMAVGLASNTLGALAWSRGRRLFLVGVAVLIGLAFLSVVRDLAGLGPLEALQKVEQSPVTSILLAPSRWFVLAFTSERIWPDLIRWSGLALLVDAGIMALIFALDASYLEAASAVSARRFAQLQRIGGGGGGIRSMKSRRTGWFQFRPPNPPWWGGVGPNFWRQMTGALGDPGRIFAVLLMLLVAPIVLIVVGSQEPSKTEPLPYVCLGLIGWMSVILSFLIPYDFRGDVDLMEELKALPITPTRLALGQLLTPTLLATFAQGIAVAVVMIGFGGIGGFGWSFLAFLLPVNFLFYAVENLLFLWYPSRIVAGQFDVMAVGRQVLFMIAKFLGLTIGLGVAASVGTLVYFASGRHIIPAIVASWIALVGSSLALVPLVGQAFANFDVSSDIPA